MGKISFRSFEEKPKNVKGVFCLALRLERENPAKTQKSKDSTIKKIKVLVRKSFFFTESTHFAY